MLEATSLRKVYQGGTVALESLDLTIRPGEVFCMLGPNGAGKTTTVRLFLNFTSPTSGTAKAGEIDVTLDPLAARRMMAYVPENVMLYGRLTGVENLIYFTALATGEKLSETAAKALLADAGLPGEAADRRVSGYSKGMRQKVGIAVATAKEARALLLDEPTSGLDPLAANEFANRIESLAERGMAVLMVTHDLFLAGRCGTRVGIMQQGRLVTTLETTGIDHTDLERVYLEASALAGASASC